MKTGNLVIEFLKLILVVIFSTVLFMIIFAILEIEKEVFPGLDLMLGILLAFIIQVIVKYNTISKLYQSANSIKSDIEIYKNRSIKLVGQANRVVDRAMNFEREVQLAVSQNKKMDIENKINTSMDLKYIIDSYPKLNSNKSVLDLLYKIESCENALANSKLSFNTSVENYNTQITSFPTNLIAKIFSFKLLRYYDEGNDVYSTFNL